MPREFKQVTAEDAWSKINGGCLQGHVMAAPAALIAAFGDPAEGDGYKTSGEYYFEDVEDEAIYYVYDWKSTTLYDPEGWRPSEFWELAEDYDFHIGGRSGEHLEEFKAWFKKKAEAI